MNCFFMENTRKSLEVPVGFEPTNGGFADPCVNQLRHGTLNKLT